MKRLLTICAVVLAISTMTKAAIWHVPGDFATIQEAINSSFVEAGDTIMVGPGEHFGALVTKSVEIKGEEGAVINDGPMHSVYDLNHGFRLNEDSDGAIINHLEFDNVDLAIMNGDAVDDVTVENCIFTNAVQAVSNWSGSGWQISHNVITDLRTICGGGIGILVADRSGGVVKNNVVSHNKISGTLHVDPGDCGGYDGSGIVLYADFRWGWPGAEKITDNHVIKNKVSLVIDDPREPGVGDPMDVWAFELTDTRDDDVLGILTIFDNAIGFNDFRGTTNQIALTPFNLDLVNEISRNLGDNRGHGLHPSVFGAGGD